MSKRYDQCVCTSPDLFSPALRIKGVLYVPVSNVLYPFGLKSCRVFSDIHITKIDGYMGEQKLVSYILAAQVLKNRTIYPLKKVCKNMPDDWQENIKKLPRAALDSWERAAEDAFRLLLDSRRGYLMQRHPPIYNHAIGAASVPSIDPTPPPLETYSFHDAYMDLAGREMQINAHDMMLQNESYINGLYLIKGHVLCQISALVREEATNRSRAAHNAEELTILNARIEAQYVLITEEMVDIGRIIMLCDILCTLISDHRRLTSVNIPSVVDKIDELKRYLESVNHFIRERITLESELIVAAFA